MFSLDGKTVLITGAAAGIGLELAHACAQRGARLALVDVNLPALEVARAALLRSGGECRVWAVDVADEAAVEALASAVRDAFGVVDVLINNAGVAYVGTFVDTPTAAWRRLLDINLMGVVHCCAAFLPQMLTAGGERRIVNVASAAGLAPNISLSAYVATKHAVVGLTETISLECAGTGVGVTLVCPGVINTGIVMKSGGLHSSPKIPAEQLERLANFYRTSGCHPSVVATDIVQAVERGRGFVLSGPFARTLYSLGRISRRLLHRVCLAKARETGYA